MKLTMDAIRKRTSIRTYDGKPLSADEGKAIRASFADAVPGPFGSSPRFMLASRDEVEDAQGDDAKGSVKIGTYGMIKGPRAFIAGVAEKKPFACVDFGYCLEGIVLRATELGLGTCWLGGAFGRGAIAAALNAGSNEFVPATTPIGHAAERRSLQDRIVYRSAGATSRKEPAELFFSAGASGASEPLTDAGRWAEVLEAVRRGPSASNKQPWRLVVDRRGGKEALHLVMHEDERYNNMLGDVKLQELDMGIAMRHVEVAAEALGIKGAWRRLEAMPLELQKPDRYISTFS
jgi:nitroreductase